MSTCPPLPSSSPRRRARCAWHVPWKKSPLPRALYSTRVKIGPFVPSPTHDSAVFMEREGAGVSAVHCVWCNIAHTIHRTWTPTNPTELVTNIVLRALPLTRFENWTYNVIRPIALFIAIPLSLRCYEKSSQHCLTCSWRRKPITEISQFFQRLSKKFGKVSYCMFICIVHITDFFIFRRYFHGIDSTVCCMKVCTVPKII